MDFHINHRSPSPRFNRRTKYGKMCAIPDKKAAKKGVRGGSKRPRRCWRKCCPHGSSGFSAYARSSPSNIENMSELIFCTCDRRRRRPERPLRKKPAPRRIRWCVEPLCFTNAISSAQRPTGWFTGSGSGFPTEKASAAGINAPIASCCGRRDELQPEQLRLLIGRGSLTGTRTDSDTACAMVRLTSFNNRSSCSSACRNSAISGCRAIFS